VLGFEPTGLVLVGDSAGGGLALSTALALRDRPATLPVTAQLALYPITDRKENHDSTDELADGYMLTREMLDWFESCYRPAASPRAYPLQAEQAGLPPTMVVTASLDPLRDQGRAYAAKCERAGVKTIFREGDGVIHGWLTFRKAIPSAQADLGKYLAEFGCLLAPQT
jgi:acetyl esterase